MTFDPSSSPIATVLVQHGTLRPGNVLVAGRTWGKVRVMLGEGRKAMREATPSTPVLTVGWKDVPSAGDECLQVINFGDPFFGPVYSGVLHPYGICTDTHKL